MAKLNANATKMHKDEKALEMFTEMLIEKIKTIQSDWKKPWFTEGCLGAARNLSGREYNGMNQLLLTLMAEKNSWEVPIYATFDRVKKLNFDSKGKRIEGEEVHVNKGEKSIPVFITTFTCVHRETKEKIPYEAWKELTEERRGEYNVFPRLNVYNVFNISQTNIKETRPELYAKLVPTKEDHVPTDNFCFEPMDRMIEENLWECPIKPTYGDDAYYSISKDEIVVPEKKQFKDGESFYSNLFHEMAHSTGAESRLNRLKPASFGSKEYAKEELIAELIAAICASHFGMIKNVKEDSVAYLKSWLESLKEDPKFLKTILADVKKASHMIIRHCEEVKFNENRKSA